MPIATDVTVQELASAVQVGRQAVYDAAGQVVAYEMLFRSTHTRLGMVTEEDREHATSHVISAVFGDFGVTDIAGPDKPLFINVTRAFVVGDLPLPDSPEQVVVEMPRTAGDDAVVAGLTTLKERGFRVAVDGWEASSGDDCVTSLADYIKIDLGAVDVAALPRAVEAARAANPEAMLAVERVENGDALRAAHELGIELFQGYHLQRPQVMETPQLSPSELMCMRLLGVLSTEDVSIPEIEEIVAGDPGLAVRVLRTASSATAAGRPVSSLRQALALIGPRMLSSWVVLMLVGGTGTVRQDHVVTLLARAGACAGLAETEPHVAYTAGLLSGVSDILGMSAIDTVRTTGVGPEVADALVSGEGSAGTALRAVLAHERGNGQAVVANGFAPFTVSRAYLDAVKQANGVASRVDA